MSAPAHSPEPTPEKLFDTINAFHRTAAIKAAIELNVFTAIGEGAATVTEIARRVGASERGIRILADYMATLGFLTKLDGRYGLAPDAAAFLDRRSPAYMGDAVRFLTAPELAGAYQNMTEVVRAGTTQMGAAGTLAPEHPIWLEFARSMAPLTTAPAADMARMAGAGEGRKWKVLDIAAGHGLFGITVLRQNPNAEVYAVDWRNVLELARENAQKAGVAERYHTIPGSAFEVDFGADYDLALVTNFIHHIDEAASVAFMKKVHAALKPGGRSAMLEFVVNEDRISPPLPAQFALIMLASTPAGEAYTHSQLERIHRNAGFRQTEVLELPRSIQSLILATK